MDDPSYREDAPRAVVGKIFHDSKASEVQDTDQFESVLNEPHYRTANRRVEGFPGESDGERFFGLKTSEPKASNARDVGPDGCLLALMKTLRVRHLLVVEFSVAAAKPPPDRLDSR